MREQAASAPSTVPQQMKVPTFRSPVPAPLRANACLGSDRDGCGACIPGPSAGAALSSQLPEVGTLGVGVSAPLSPVLLPLLFKLNKKLQKEHP